MKHKIILFSCIFSLVVLNSVFAREMTSEEYDTYKSEVLKAAGLNTGARYRGQGKTADNRASLMCGYLDWLNNENTLIDCTWWTFDSTKNDLTANIITYNKDTKTVTKQDSRQYSSPLLDGRKYFITGLTKIVDEQGKIYSVNTLDKLYLFVSGNYTKLVEASNGILANDIFAKDVYIKVGQSGEKWYDSQFCIKMIDKSHQSAYLQFNDSIYEATYDKSSGAMTQLKCIADAANKILLIIGQSESYKETDANAVYKELVKSFTEQNPNNATIQSIFGLTQSVQAASSVLNDEQATTISKLTSANEVYNELIKQGVTKEKAAAVRDALKTVVQTIKIISPTRLDGYEWIKDASGNYKLQKGSTYYNKTGWVLNNDGSTYRLYYFKDGVMQVNYNSDYSLGIACRTDASGYGYCYDTKVEVANEKQFKTLQDTKINELKQANFTAETMTTLASQGLASTNAVQEVKNVSPLQDAQNNVGGVTGPGGGGTINQQSAMDSVGASNIDANGQQVQGNGWSTVTTNTDTSKITMTYNQTYDSFTVSDGEDHSTTYYIPKTDFKVDWPQQYKIVNGNLKSKSHYIPTKDEVQEVIASMYANAPNGASNMTDAAFSAMNREGNETFNESLPKDLRRMFGGDYYDIDTVVDPISIVAANIDCLGYDASSVNWSTTEPTNGWILSQSNQWVASNDLINMMILKAFGEYQYYSCFTVDQSQGEGVVTLYITRSVMEQYRDFKDSIFKAGLATEEQPMTFNDVIKYIYYLDEKYAPLRNEKINMEGLKESDYKGVGINDVTDAGLKNAIYYLVNQGYFTIDEISDKFGSSMTEELTSYIVKKIYNVVNRNVNINTRVKTN